MNNRKQFDIPYTSLELHHLKIDGVKLKPSDYKARSGGQGIEISETALGGLVERIIIGKPADHFAPDNLTK